VGARGRGRGWGPPGLHEPPLVSKVQGYLVRREARMHISTLKLEFEPNNLSNMGTPARTHGVGTPSLYSGEDQEDWGLGGIRRIYCIKGKFV
jgi:hypothetical protein